MIKKLLLIFLFFAFCSTAQATISRVQVASQNCTYAASCSVNIAFVQPHDLIVVTSLVYSYTAWPVLPTVTDNQSNPYTQIWNKTVMGGGYFNFTMNYAYNVTNSPMTITVSSSNSTSIAMIVTEYAGVVSTSNPLDVSTGVTSGTGTSYASASVTTHAANELLVGGVFNNVGGISGTTYTGTNGWTNFSIQKEQISNNTISMQDQGVTSSGSYANTGTAAFNGNSVGMAAFETTQAPAINIPTEFPTVNRTFYIANNDKNTNASDSNNGRSKSSAWLHAPAMPGCTAICASITPQPGDSFIFRGGDSWHMSAGTPVGLPWNWSWSGNATPQGSPSQSIYLGVDQSWYAGSSWTRPIMDLDNPTSTSAVSKCAYDDGKTYGVAIPANYVTFDNFEFTGLCWSVYSAYGGGWYTSRYGTNITISNNYFHGWTHTSPVYTTGTTATSSGSVLTDNTQAFDSTYIGAQLIINSGTGANTGTYTITSVTNTALTVGSSIGTSTAGNISYSVHCYNCDFGTMIGGTTSYPNGNPVDNNVVENNVINGADTDGVSGQAVGYDGYDVHGNIISYVSNGMVSNNVHTVHNNIFHHINNSYDDTNHSNVFETNGEIAASNYVYDNIFYDNTAAVHIWTIPAAGQTDYYYNNVIYNVTTGTSGGNPVASNCWLIAGAASAVYFINNTFVATGSPYAPCYVRNSASESEGGPYIGKEYYYNNHFIGYSNLTAGPINVTSTGDNGANAKIIEGVDLYPTESVANAQGYLPANNYAPTSVSGGTINAGENLTSLNVTGLDMDILGVVRSSTGPWDIGAYQFTGPSSTGDVSGNGTVTMYDAALVLQFLSGGSLSQTQQSAAEITGDNAPSTADIVAIAKKAMGL